MREKIVPEMISRRSALGVLAVAVAFGIGVPSLVLTASNAEAQTQGMERRQDRRDNRRDRRTDRRDNRRDRRDDRRTGRQDRRDDRRGTVGQGSNK